MKKIQLTDLLIFIVSAELVGAAAALFVGDFSLLYETVQKPPLSPPAWLFPVVWTILYVMMGLASYLVMTSTADKTLLIKALVFYTIQLALNFFWSILFFNMSLYLWAFAELSAMWICIFITMILFLEASVPAGVLMIPYILWSSFALYLNFAVYKLSITPMPLPK